ncbi:interleukin-1 receptor accessory protein isoform X2 [Festucalex cinctus]
MTSVIFFVPLLVAMVTAELHAPDPPYDCPLCFNWIQKQKSRCNWVKSPSGVVHVLEGEATWVRCPLFHHNDSSRNLTWYRGLEQPIADNARLSKERDKLYFQPAVAKDAGCYTCMLRQQWACAVMCVIVVPRPQVAPEGRKCNWPLATALLQVVAPLQCDTTLDCPDWQEAVDMADSAPNVTWYHECVPAGKWTSNREQDGARVVIHYMVDHYQGVYVCQVHYQRAGRALHFTRRLSVTAVMPTFLPKEPSVLHPTAEHVFRVTPGSDARLECRGHFPYLDSDRDIWWSVDGKKLDQLAEPRFSESNKSVISKHGDDIVTRVLLIRNFGYEDLGKSYNCSVRNRRGFHTRRAQLEVEASVPSLELACGLSVMLVTSMLLLAFYHVFRLELLLLYRSWFGTDERHTDDKEFDVYISYARNSDEEKFVLRTLRRVLENDLGYTVCIFDRDSLPGGTITDETLSFVARSRRLVVVLGPGYARQGSQALLELKAGVDGLAGGHLRLILVQYKRVRRQEWVRELRRARMALAVVRWQGEPSREMTSRFWKKLRLELPVRRMPGTRGDEESGKEAGLMTTAGLLST